MVSGGTPVTTSTTTSFRARRRAVLEPTKKFLESSISPGGRTRPTWRIRACPPLLRARVLNMERLLPAPKSRSKTAIWSSVAGAPVLAPSKRIRWCTVAAPALHSSRNLACFP
uniref:Uncharacterized protein n=1 Tax=Opuntia streptacantha TaxID=393608 RepID=A0A7C8ZL42_OPUST